ncbi:hypothetical protein BDP55DRAFT_633955 [Colletotrichum godetiae]|uniref:Uncharacterized protein n=1 Tax=Colletotrichum godetiae TaxID=1209918 RepID=A0AAJ0AJS5_9PEZI|nr:uncharacterized protein BDP55DRAFT_633955 [Colletotrichum godetiae]KAK1673682.1 hypothetical protein BDP55DRAFT_633955 [Colletotrichum godetiae]
MVLPSIALLKTPSPAPLSDPSSGRDCESEGSSLELRLLALNNALGPLELWSTILSQAVRHVHKTMSTGKDKISVRRDRNHVTRNHHLHSLIYMPIVSINRFPGYKLLSWLAHQNAETDEIESSGRYEIVHSRKRKGVTVVCQGWIFKYIASIGGYHVNLRAEALFCPLESV